MTEWRDTLFIWDGILVAPPSGKEDSSSTPKVQWIGTWVGVNEREAIKVAAPKRGAFEKDVKSEMTFAVEGTAAVQKDNKDDERVLISLTDGRGWDLKDEDSSNKKTHQDKTHDLLLSSLKWSGNLLNPTANYAFACGKNEFAPFVSVGWMRPGNRLTLARRYLSDGDAREQWTLSEFRTRVLKELAQTKMEKQRPPWQCALLNADFSPEKDSNKRPSPEGEETEKSKMAKTE